MKQAKIELAGAIGWSGDELAVVTCGCARE
jgi:hypothetical protein